MSRRAVWLLMALLWLSPSLQAATVFTQGEALLSAVQGFMVTAGGIGVFIGVAWGALMRQLAGGDPQQVQRGEMIMKNSIIAWAILTGLGLILSTLTPFLK